MTHVAYFGDGEHSFALTMPMVRELEQKAGVGIGALYQRLMSAQFFMGDLVEIVRLGLIGAGMSPAKAQHLVETYAVDRPVMEITPLALDIIEARWSGKAVAAEAPQASDAADLVAAIHDAYADV